MIFQLQWRKPIMERELWKTIYRLARELDRTTGNAFYRDWEIVVIYFWGVIHDRPTSWACRRDSWNVEVPVRLPDQSTVSRRLRSGPVETVVDEIKASLCSGDDGGRYLCVDGKPLVVSDHSKDRDARTGRAGKGFAKGYRLHAIWGNKPVPEAFRVEPLNTGEAKVARQLIAQINNNRFRWIVGDKQYDSNPLHDEAVKNNFQLTAEQKRPGKLGHRRHSPGRIRCLNMIDTPFCRRLLHFRDRIERRFGTLTCTATGLGPLPAWVRGLRRVRMWVKAKIITNAIRSIYKSNYPKHALA